MVNLQVEINNPATTSYYTGMQIGKTYRVTLTDADYVDTSNTDTLVYITISNIKQKYGSNHKIYLPLNVNGKGFNQMSREFIFDSNPSSNLVITVYDSSTNASPAFFSYLHLNFDIEEL